ncbi:FixH family protein [Azospirillum picis]|uniref:Nitrogen fixation protein FixH n=1 Tax=Azospirillum picis TaxID=488438 RepID=A0ABU0MPT8_9PROT|nr:FixH family protein [Azospirillum picis]MBP2301683.1 nitrogen fixation protein FixH [Azospirillum picis]MDQ0535494.1 nitrogen fixation protein FixH [Azospirillum picis]
MTTSSVTGNTTIPPRSSGAKTARQKGWYIPWIFVGLFMVVLAVNMVMVHFAMSTWTGVETQDHFVKGISYNRDLAGARAQAERGWKVQTDFTSTEPRKAVVAITVHDKDGGVLKDAAVSVTLIRPTSEGHDKTLSLPYLGEGRYAAPVELDLEGQWDLRLVVTHASGDYQDQKRVWVQ